MSVKASAVLAKAASLSSSTVPKSLGKWLVRNHDEFDAKLPAEPDWDAIVLALAEVGIAREDGTPIRADTARRTWNRVHRRVMEARGPTPAAAFSPPPEVPVACVSPYPVVNPSREWAIKPLTGPSYLGPSEHEPRRQIKTASPKTYKDDQT